VTGIEVVIGNCLPEVRKIGYCPILRTEVKKFPIMVDDASCHLVLLYLNACVYLAPLSR